MSLLRLLPWASQWTKTGRWGCLNEGQRRRKVIGVEKKEDVKNNMRRKLLIWLKINVKWNLE